MDDKILDWFPQLIYRNEFLTFKHLLINCSDPVITRQQVMFIPESRKNKRAINTIDSWLTSREVIEFPSPFRHKSKTPKTDRAKALEQALAAYEAMHTCNRFVWRHLHALANSYEMNHQAFFLSEALHGKQFHPYGGLRNVGPTEFFKVPSKLEVATSTMCKHLTNLLGWYKHGNVLMGRIMS